MESEQCIEHVRWSSLLLSSDIHFALQHLELAQLAFPVGLSLVIRAWLSLLILLHSIVPCVVPMEVYNEGTQQDMDRVQSRNWDTEGNRRVLIDIQGLWKEIQTLGGWRDGSVVKSMGCSFRGIRFNSQYLHDGSQPPVTLVPGDLTLSGVCGHQVPHWCIDIHADKTLRHIK